MNLLTFLLLIRSDWVTVVFVLILLLLGAAKYLYKDRLSQLVVVFFSKHYFLNYGKESQLIFGNFNKLLFTVQTLIFSLFIYLFVQFFREDYKVENELFLFLKITIGIVLYFSIRYIVGIFLGILFNINKMHSRLVFSKMVYLFSVSIILFPFLLLTFYIKSSNLMIFKLSGLILVILLIMRYIFVLKNNKKLLFDGLFYFILYLCALEIAPLLLVFKIIN